MSRDSKRGDTYAAEEEADERTVCAKPTNLPELSRLASAITTHLWWQENVGSAPVQVVEGKSQQRSSYDATTRVLRLGVPHRNTSTLCHELAHAADFDALSSGDAAEHASHGRHFRGWHVAVRWLLHGKSCGDDLAHVYGLYGLGVTLPAADVPAWASPVLDPSGYDRVWVSGTPLAQ